MPGTNNSKKVLVLGASLKPIRYSNKAIHRLSEAGHEVYAVGNRIGELAGVALTTELPEEKDIHTVTVYLGAANQEPYIDYLLELNPKRVIFNPGAENPVLFKALRAKDVECFNACTLVMLSIDSF